MKKHSVEQNTDEWLSLRLGKITASAMKNIISSGGKKSTSSKTYMHQLIAEKLTNSNPDDVSFSNAWTEQGHEREDVARSMYEFVRDAVVDDAGFITDDNENVGVSCDGLIGDDGLIEIKCPKASTYISYKLDGRCPTVYFPQIQSQLWITERKWCDFVVYHPKFELHIVRVERDDNFIDKMRDYVDKFVVEMKEKMDILK